MKGNWTPIIFLIVVMTLFVAPASAAGTTSVQIIKYANDGTTILNQTTVDFHWMETNLPVYGDGFTHYYMQGPVMNSSIPNKWNPEENDTAILDKDFGAAKGTNLKDLCDLVGGMDPSDYNVTLLASDGFSKPFAYSSVYNPPSRAGPIILTWYRADLGYVTDSYNTGIRNVNFADTSNNPWGVNAFGLWDMHETYPEAFWYYYQPGQPSATGLSVQKINRVLVYSNEPAPVAPVAAFTADVTTGQVPLIVHFTDASTGTAPLSYAWDFTNDGTVDSTIQNPTFTYSTSGTHTVNLTVTNAQGVDSEVKASYIVANSPVSPEYSLLLTGDHSVTLTKAQIEAIVTSGPSASWTDSTNQRTWQGIPLWYLVGAVDDADTGFNFNSTRSSLNYVVQVRANDGFFKNFSSSTIASNNNYFIANTLNGTVIPFADPTNSLKFWWPLKLAGAGPTGGNSVGNITEIRLIGLPAAPAAPVAAFGANVTTGSAPLTVQFTDASSGSPSSWAWDFDNDGTIDSTTQSPVYTYSAAGVYSVNFSVSNAAGSNSTLKSNYINATSVAPVLDTIYSGTVSLSTGTFTKTAYNTGSSYVINTTTPLGALNGAGLSFKISDKNYATQGYFLLDGIGSYDYDKTAGKTWICQLNGVTLDDYGHPATDGLNIRTVSNGDHLNFYYGVKPVTPQNAIAAALITVSTGGEPSTDYSLSMKGKVNRIITRAQFEEALACVPSGHNVTWTDANGSVWGGIPLWVLVGMIDDEESGSHYTFNDALATQGYTVKVKAADWDTSLASADIARDGGYLVANTLNGTALPTTTPGGKPCWPLMLKGSSVFGGQQVGGINEIELVGLPQPAEGWTLTMEGDVTDVITQQYFEQAIVCHHNVTYTDSGGSVWTGVPLWDLVGSVDDIETSSHWTFNDTRATGGYTVRLIAGDGYNRTFTSQVMSHNDGFIVANTLNGSALSGSNGHLKLVGPATTSSGQRIGNITTIRLEGLPSYPAGTYSLTLKGRIKDVITQPELEEWIAHHQSTYTDDSSNVYTGIPLWRLMGWVDDRIPHGSNGFNDSAASAGYKVIVKAGDGYSKEFTSAAIGKNDNYILANMMNGAALPTTGSHPPWPLRLVGTGATGGNSVGNVVEIELTEFQTPTTAAPLHIIKYAADGVTIVNETTVTREWMEQNLAIIGDGTTLYKYEGLTLNSSNLWDPEETYPGGYKISNAVKGSRVMDLCNLVGGMGSGTDIKFIASDGYETTLPYSSIYTNPAVQARQGDAILAWYADGQYVPGYQDGMRLFFTPDDHVYGQWDMHESLPSGYWHYNTQNGVNYPSCAGTSAKLITTVKIYSSPASDWNLVLDGRDIGGLNYTVGKVYFEQALACQFGSNHEVNYTDSSSRVWSGMPLWFLCGFVDDADQHSSNSYNETKAQAGYNVTITATDGYSVTLNSRDTIRSNNYIIANTLNGTLLPETGDSWPLRLVGQNVTGQKIVKKVASIRLTPISTQPPGPQSLSLVPVSNNVPIGQNAQYQLVINSLPDGLAGYDLVITLTDPNIGKIVNVTYPSWAGLSDTGNLPANSVKISSVDVNKMVQAGSLNTVIATITIRGDAPGTSPISISSVHMDADGGGVVTPAISNGQLNVFSPIVADFSANRTFGMASANVSLDIAFTDLSTGNPVPSSWQWNFGNGAFATQTSPVAKYNGPGLYTVNLTVSNAYTQATTTKQNYINVTPFVKPFPGYTALPTDTNGDYLIEDINGNGRLDYDDVVVYYQNMVWISAQYDVGIAPYDYNHNGRIDYDDVVLLYWIVLG